MYYQIQAQQDLRLMVLHEQLNGLGHLHHHLDLQTQ